MLPNILRCSHFRPFYNVQTHSHMYHNSWDQLSSLHSWLHCIAHWLQQRQPTTTIKPVHIKTWGKQRWREREWLTNRWDSHHERKTSVAFQRKKCRWKKKSDFDWVKKYRISELAHSLIIFPVFREEFKKIKQKLYCNPSFNCILFVAFYFFHQILPEKL